MPRRLALLGVLISCLTLLVGCVAVQPKADGTWSLSFLPPSSETVVTHGPSTSKGGVKNVTNDAGAAGSAASPTYPGKTLQSGPWKVVVENTTSPRRLEDGARPSAGKTFLIVDVAIRNAGSGAALTVLPNQFALWDSANHVVDPVSTKLGIYNAQSVRPIDAGMGGFTSFVYEVPNRPAVYTFTMTPKQGGSGSMSWYVP